MDLLRLFWQAITAEDQTVPAGGGGGLTYAEAVLDLDPDAFWRLGESSGDLVDASGNGHTATAVGLTYGVAGWPGDDDTACVFGGTDYATVADNAAWNVGTGDFSVSWCMKRNGTPSGDEDVICRDFQGYGYSWGVRLPNNTSFIVVMANGTYNLTYTGVSLYDDAWHHCVVTFDRSGYARLYVDGDEVGSVDISASVADDLTNSRPLWIGASDAGGFENYNGALDEVVYWKSRLLSAGEVTTLFEARNGEGGEEPPPAGTYLDAVLALTPTAHWRLGEASGNLADSSGNAHTLTASGLTYGQPGWTGDGNGAIRWSGSGSYATAADDAAWDIGSGDFSIAWCMRKNGAPGDSMDLLCHDFQGYGVGDWGVRLGGSSNLLVVLVGGAYMLWHSGTLYDDVLHHCVLTVDRDGPATFYVDGVSRGSVTVSADANTDLSNTRSLWLGATDAELENYDGVLDEVTYWKSRLLSPSEVAALHAARG